MMENTKNGAQYTFEGFEVTNVRNTYGHYKLLE